MNSSLSLGTVCINIFVQLQSPFWDVGLAFSVVLLPPRWTEIPRVSDTGRTMGGRSTLMFLYSHGCAIGQRISYCSEEPVYPGELVSKQ